MRLKTRRRGLIGPLSLFGPALLALVVVASAEEKPGDGPTAAFELDSFKQLDEGQVEGALITSQGEVVPGLGQRKLKKVEATMIWSRARAADGTVYFGSGDSGKVFSVRDDRIKVVARLDAVLVTALAAGPGNTLYAATMPDARILAVNTKTGKWRQLAKLPAEHAWALVYDGKRKRVFVASGSPGKLYAVPTGGGKPEVWFDPAEKHLLFLTRSPAGALLTGGSDKAILYRVTSKRRATALHDFDATELRTAVTTPDGATYVAVNKFPRKESGVPRFDRAEKGAAGTPIASKNSSKKKPAYQPGELRPGAKSGKGALFRIDASGRMEALLTLDRGYITDVAVDPEGRVWAAEGAEGKVYRLEGARAVATVFDLSERQVLALAVMGTQRYLGTGDGAAIYRVLSQPKKPPTYQSKALDAQYRARWGIVQVQASAKLSLLSRSGNTAKPDDTWSGWVAAEARPDSRALLGSSAARYLQIKAVWRQPYQGALRSFQVYYRPQNQRAHVEMIEFDRGKRKEAKIKISWKVDNPDKDPLVYRVYYREDQSASEGPQAVPWRPIDPHLPLDKPSYEWDTEGIADGTYRIRVVASDEPANGPTVTLIDARVSPPLIVDNRKPLVSKVTVRFPWAKGQVRDTYSPIRAIEYAIDGKPTWRLVEPADGVYDSPVEWFRIALPANLSKSTHVLAIRVRDSAGNVGVRQLRFRRR